MSSHRVAGPASTVQLSSALLFLLGALSLRLAPSRPVSSSADPLGMSPAMCVLPMEGPILVQGQGIQQSASAGWRDGPGGCLSRPGHWAMLTVLRAVWPRGYALPTAVSLDLSSIYLSCFFLPMKNKHPGQPGSKPGGKVLVCHCSCQALTAPACSPGALKGNTGLGPAHPIPSCAWPPMPGPCPFLDKASHTPATSRLRISNFMHPQPEPQPGLSSVFTLSHVAGTTLVPGQCGCEWRLDCWSADQCCRELSGYGHLCLPQGLGHPSVEQLLTPCLLATLAMPHLLFGYKWSPTLSGPWHLPL